MSKSWQSKVIGEFSKLTAGGTPSTKNKEFWSNGSIPWLSSGEIHKKRIHFADNFITEEGLKNSAAKIIPKKTLLVALAGQGKTRGTVAITEIETTTNQSIAGIITRADICDPDYLFFNLDSRYDELRAISGGSGRAGLNLEILSNVEVALPPHPQQKKIASILTSVDEVIENTQKQIDKLQDLKKATMNELLTKGIGHTEFKDSELGRIPKSWEVKKLSDVGVCIRGLTYSPDDISETGLLVLRSSNIQSGRISLHDNVFVDVDVKPQFKAKKGDILICVRNGSRALLGKSALIDEHITNATHGAFMTIFRSDSYAFIRYLFESNLFFSQVSRDIGATINSINNSNLLQYKFAFPNVDEQIRIAEILQRFDRNIDNNIMKLNHSISLKKSLMQDLLTGKVRVQAN